MSPAKASSPAAELSAAIEQLPEFIRSPRFLPTRRIPTALAIAGLRRVEQLYASGLDETYRPRLRALKAARTRRRCFIIGNGPSLAATDLERLKSEATFATDGFLLKIPELGWSPTYYVVEDHLVGEGRADELSNLSGTTKLFPANLAYVLEPDDNTIYFDHRPRASHPDGYDFSFDADANTFIGGTVAFTCMQLAAYLGYQEIYLIGVDADDSSPTDAALPGDRRVNEVDMRPDDLLAAYAEARRATESRGVSIVNASAGGKLEVFRRVDFEMLFRPVPAERLLVIDHTVIGNSTATGAVKSAVLGNWPSERLAQVHDAGGGRPHLTGGPGDVAAGTSLMEQITSFDPDLVLYRPVPQTEAIHELAMELIATADLPLALWIVDDWPAAYAHEDPEAAARLEADLRWLLTRADACFSISPPMSAAFHERYGRLFVPIANGVDPADWPPPRPRSSAHLTVRYAGSLAHNMTLDSVGLVARAVEELVDSGGLDMSFEIKTHGHWRRATDAEWLAGMRHTSVTTSDLTMADYQRWLTEADILLIAYNFDARSRDYIRYSQANKLPECLASGAAVLAVGPEDVGTIATMAALDVGERVTAPDPAQIVDALRRLAASPELRFELGRRGQSVAFSQFDVHQTRSAFEATVGRAAAAHHTGDYPRDIHANVDETAVVASILGNRRGRSHVMLDVGAHRGSAAIHFARLGWAVHCFEPHPATRATLAARFANNANVHIDPRAVGDAPATSVLLYESLESSGIATLEPFHASHTSGPTVDVTTIAEVVHDLGLSAVDFLKVDAEGLDLAVLRGVPWRELRPDVVACEFEDAKTLAHGHSWREIATFLQDEGYVVYVSEWHPVIQYGLRHDWRRVVPFNRGLELEPAAWGNLVAFREDPGWPLVRRVFDRHIRRGTQPRLDPPPRPPVAPARKTPEPPPPALAQPEPPPTPDVAPDDGRAMMEEQPVPPLHPAPDPRSAPRPGRRALHLPRRLRSRRATVEQSQRPDRRGLARLWRHRWRVIPPAVVVGALTVVGFATPAPLSWLLWAGTAAAAVGLGMLYAAHLHDSLRATRKRTASLREQQKVDRRRLNEAYAAIGRLERALSDATARNADLARRIDRLEVPGGGANAAVEDERRG